jgi:hypothetical protein
MVASAVKIYGKISSTKSKEFSMDRSTHAFNCIDHALHKIFEGASFSVSDSVVCDTTTVKWQITTPNTTKYSHLKFSLSSTGEATFLVTEGSDRTDGTALSEVNKKRVGTPTAATTIVTRTPTGGSTDGATTLFSIRKSTTIQPDENDFWILKPNTKYVISITTYAAVYATMKIDWAEHTDKD